MRVSHLCSHMLCSSYNGMVRRPGTCQVAHTRILGMFRHGKAQT